MSWFGREFTSLCASEEHCSTTDTVLDQEVGDGVVVERRSVLWLSVAAVGAALTGGVSAQDQRQEGQQRKGKKQERKKQNGAKLSFEQFLNDIYPLAKRIVASKGKDEEAYLMTVAASMARLAEPGGDVRSAMRAFRAKHRDDRRARFPISAMTLRLRPGGGFRHHDHLNYNGVILGVQGECRIRNFDILGKDQEPPMGKTFEIRQTRDDLILPGRMSSLGCKRDNIHELVAGKEGARLLDVFTFFERGATSRFLDVEKKPKDAERRIYEAAWTPPRRRRRR